MAMRAAHPFTPRWSPTQCTIPGCWGWVDDPRHTTLRRMPTGLARTYRAPRGPSVLDQPCPTCNAPRGHRCWDMRSATQSNSNDPKNWRTAVRPHDARRVWRGEGTDWTRYAACTTRRCGAAGGEPCTDTRPGWPVRYKSRPHDWRPTKGKRSDA